MSKPEGLIQQADYEEAEVFGESATVGVRRLLRAQAPIEGWPLAGAGQSIQ